MENVPLYAGIGARKTPPHILELMTQMAQILDQQGFTLRSGGANGADSAFAKGASKKEIYVPFASFNGGVAGAIDCRQLPNHARALEIAKGFHPAWDRCSDFAKDCHARNIYILGGVDINWPVDFVVCWTEGGTDVGGTGLAIRAANKIKIPVFNLFNADALDKLEAFLAELGAKNGN